MALTQYILKGVRARQVRRLAQGLGILRLRPFLSIVLQNTVSFCLLWPPRLGYREFDQIMQPIGALQGHQTKDRIKGMIHIRLIAFRRAKRWSMPRLKKT